DAVDLLATDFNKKHPVTATFIEEDSRLQLYLPRTVRKLQAGAPAADAPVVEELVFTGPQAQMYVAGKPSGPVGKFPLIAAVEKGAITDVKNERGTTRIVIAGDALFLANTMLGSADNRRFANNAVNWLLERSELLQGTPPQPIMTYKIVMTNSQMRNT